LAVRGHTLVLHEALPAWFDLGKGPEDARRILAAHIRTVCRRYAGRIHSWDVVNEPLELTDRQPGGLRASPFLRVLGPDYIATALTMAAEADPAAQLVINEYDLELSHPSQEARRLAMLELLNSLVRARVPLHALGLQAHIAPGSAPLDPAVIRSFIRSVADLGLAVQVTELDVIDRLLPADPARRDAEVARTFGEFLGIVLAEPSVRIVGLWGLSDRGSWINGAPSIRRRDGLPARSHPYDDAFQPKPARVAIANALRMAPTRG
jgi:endo-1,4-beta-xylanase